MKKYLILPIAAALLLSCAKEPVFEPLPDGDLIPLNIDGSISQVATKATAQGFVDGDAVGLFAVNYSEGNTVAGTLAATGNQADNVKYVFDEAAFKWTPVKGVYYKDVNTHVDLYVYYPYQAGISDVAASGFEVQKDQSSAATATALSGYEASDWLWGKATDITPSESKVQIPLSHKLSAVQVTLVEGTGFGEGEFESLSKSVILTNTTRKATLNFQTGEATPLGNPQLDGIVMCPQTTGAFRAIVIPQSIAAGTQLFAITLDGISYSFTQGSIVTYQAGKQMNVDITLNKKSASGDYELVLGGTSIVDWAEDLNTHGGEARQYYVATVTTPGTLGDVIAAAGKNPDKIRNLKVVGFANEQDFYFMRDNMAILEAVNMKECKIKDVVAHTSYGQNEKGEWGYWPDEWVDDVIPERAFSQKSTLTYFSFPEIVTEIGGGAFFQTKLAGALIVPDDVRIIYSSAFEETLVSSVDLPLHLEMVDNWAFAHCSSLTGSLNLPESLTHIGAYAFYKCHLSGHLSLPDCLTFIGTCAFNDAGSFTGDLVIPASVTKLEGNETFYTSQFTGRLIFEGNTDIGAPSAFNSCGFTGELHIPEGMTTIPSGCFYNNRFTSVYLPSTLKEIKDGGLGYNPWLESVSFQEGLISIGEFAFHYCHQLRSLELPSTLQTIQANAFQYDYNISNISCSATEPPTVLANAFEGVAKDNFAVQVPEQSIIRYQTENGWSDFRRIVAHYDFSIGRTRLRLLNKGESRTYTLRCPSGNAWNIESKPDWISVNPSSGTGKTDVTITVSDMARTNDTFEVNQGTFNSPSYKNYAGRAGTVIFSLDGKDYTCELKVEQYDCDYVDGQAVTLQSASRGSGIDIVFIGEGFDAKDIADGKFTSAAETGSEHLFNVEPYATYSDYFNVYSVITKSDDSGIEDVNTVVDNKFTSVDECFLWARKAKAGLNFSRSVVIMLQNNPAYYGWTYMYSDGSALAVVPVSEQAYPRDFRGLIQHEAGGHAFGKLADEYIYHNAYITSCSCICCDHPSSEYDLLSQYGRFKSLGWFKNISLYSDHNRVPWAHLIYHPSYSNRVDMYEGAYMHTRGMYRSEVTSCMNNNIPYFSAISRQAIVERIKRYAGETFTLADFYANDSFAVGTKASARDFDWTFGVDPNWHDGPEHGSIIFMGEKPNID